LAQGLQLREAVGNLCYASRPEPFESLHLAE